MPYLSEQLLSPEHVFLALQKIYWANPLLCYYPTVLWMPRAQLLGEPLQPKPISYQIYMSKKYKLLVFFSVPLFIACIWFLCTIL